MSNEAKLKIAKVKIKDLNKYIDETLANVTKNEKRLHNAAYACVERAMSNGDVRPAKRLVSGLGRRSVRVNAMLKYFLAVGPFLYNEETKEMEINPAMKEGTSYKGDLETAWSKPFWEYTASEGKDTTFDLEKLLHSLAKRTAKRIQDPKEGDNLPTALVRLLQEVDPEAFMSEQPNEQAKQDALAA